MAAQVTIRDHAEKLSIAANHAHTSKTFLGHDDDDITHACGHWNQRHIITLMHEISDKLQIGAEASSGMIGLEVDGGEAAIFKERNGQCITKTKLHGGGGGRSQAMRAGLFDLWQAERDV